MNRNKVLFVLAVVLSLTLACSLTNNPDAGSGPDGGSAPPDSRLPSPTVIPSAPVSIRAGLASLNSYTLVIESNYSGPTLADYSQSHYEIQNSNDLDARVTHTVTTESSEGDYEPYTSDSYSYTIGNAECSGSDVDGWSYVETTPQEAEMQELFSEMMDIVPLIDTPTFVSSELLNGIMTNHFTFRISGLGLTSGAQVITNQGDYWLAQDGQYIVRYFLVTETLDPTYQTTQHMELLIEVKDINQPVNIVFPAGCIP